jgi:hypothetical protein
MPFLASLGHLTSLGRENSVLREAEAETRRTLKAVRATDRLIDRIAYQLYGLTDEEIAVVEG